MAILATGTRRRRGPVLRQYQASVLQLLIRGVARYPGETFTVLFPRQAGKNEVAAAFVAWALRTHAEAGGSIVICAPTLVPQARISLQRVQRALADTTGLFPAAPIAVSGTTIRAGQAEAVFLSASPQANVAGHTASIAIVADEAQDIDREWFDRQFRPMAASTGAPVIMFGTPWDGHSLLDEQVARNRRRDAAQPGRRFADWLPLHHEVPWESVAEAVPAYGRHVRAEMERLGAAHPLFVTQYGLQTVGALGRLLTPAQLANLAGAHGRETAPWPGARYVAGLDIAGVGEDRTVLTIGRVAGDALEVVHHVSWQSADLDDQSRDVATLVREWRFERLCVDASGIGAQIGQQLAREFGPAVEPVVFTAGTKSALGFTLVGAAGFGRLRLYAHDGSRRLRRLPRGTARLRADDGAERADALVGRTRPRRLCGEPRAGRPRGRWRRRPTRGDRPPQGGHAAGRVNAPSRPAGPPTSATRPAIPLRARRR